MAGARPAEERTMGRKRKTLPVLLNTTQLLSLSRDPCNDQVVSRLYLPLFPQGATASDSLHSTVLIYETPLALAHTCCHGRHGFLDTSYLFTKAEGIRKGRENTKI